VLTPYLSHDRGPDPQTWLSRILRRPPDDKAAVRRHRRFLPARTSHGSTLSRPVCSWLLARADRTRSWSMLNEALDSDLADIQRGTTREGIHLDGGYRRSAPAVLRRSGDSEGQAPASPGFSHRAWAGQVSDQLPEPLDSRGSDIVNHGASTADPRRPADSGLCGRQDDHHACGPRLPVHVRRLRQR